MNGNSNIYGILQEGNLLEALTMLQTKIASLDNWQLQQELEQASQTYATMLSYFSKGVDDPEFGKMRQQLIQQAYSLNDRANIAIRLKKDLGAAYCLRHNDLLLHPTNLSELSVALTTTCRKLKDLENNPNDRKNIQEYDEEQTVDQHEELVEKLFNTIWAGDIWDKSTYSQYGDLLNDNDITDDDKAVIVSATLLSVYELFDPLKIMFLFDAYLYSNPIVSQRALVGIMLLLARFDSRLKYYPQLTSRFNLYAENSQFVHECFTVLMQLQYSKLTDVVSAKMMNDIMPAIMKSARFQQTEIGLQEIDEELTKHGENPEWHHNSRDSKKAEKKIKQMTDMQLEGADVYMSSFRHLKSFGFFSTLHHWFLPFTFQQKEMLQVKKHLRKEIINIAQSLLSASPFCDSDMYSFVMMVDSVPQSGQDILSQQIQSQIGDEDREDFFSRRKKAPKDNATISRNYIFDLYRFFKINPNRSQFFDPFNRSLPNFSPLNFNTFQPLHQYTDEMLVLAEFLMRKEAYHDAINIFKNLSPNQVEEDADIWQKIGFCQQKMGDREALATYLLADSLQPGSSWTRMHIAQVAFDQHDYATASKYIDMILADDEDNLKWISRKAECLFGQDKYEECLPLLYKLTYLDEASEKPHEMLAWGLFMTGNLDKAENEYKTLCKQFPSVKNSIMLAHLYSVKGQTAEAIHIYNDAYIQSAQTGKFKDEFFSLSAYLQKAGLSRERLQTIYEAVVSLPH